MGDKTFFIDMTGDMGYAVVGTHSTNPYYDKRSERFLRVDVPAADRARFSLVLERKRTAVRAMKAAAASISVSV